jgi:hypothetical protein
VATAAAEAAAACKVCSNVLLALHLNPHKVGESLAGCITLKDNTCIIAMMCKAASDPSEISLHRLFLLQLQGKLNPRGFFRAALERTPFMTLIEMSTQYLCNVSSRSQVTPFPFHSVPFAVRLSLKDILPISPPHVKAASKLRFFLYLSTDLSTMISELTRLCIIT